MDQLVRRLQADFPTLTFTAGTLLCWSPQSHEIYYQATSDDTGSWGLLHELGHAQLGHANFTSDVDLVKKEAQAWRAAQGLAKTYGFTIAPDHIQDCLDTYRDWLYRRSTCPTCHAAGLQDTPTSYVCPNCQATWLVTHSRFCRAYRRSYVA